MRIVLYVVPTFRSARREIVAVSTNAAHHGATIS